MVGIAVKKFVLLVILVISVAFSQTQPNYVRTTTYIDIPGSTLPGKIVATSFSDGLGRDFQDQLLLNDTNASLISAKVYDLAGRPCTTIVPFVNPGKNYIADSIVKKANTANNDTFSFSSVVYIQDPSNRIIASGGPGRSYSLDGDAQGEHHTKYWYFGLAKDTCIPCKELKDTVNGGLNTRSHDLNSKYFLTVTKDPNGNYSQQLVDAFGNVRRSWSHLDQRGKAGTTSCDESKAIITRYTYDALGNITTEYSPDSTFPPANYTYNTLNQLISKTSADAGTVTYKYSNAGYLDTVIDQLQSNRVALDTSLASIQLINTYDSFGRILQTYIDKKSKSSIHSYQPKVRNIYDDPSSALSFICSAASADSQLLKLRNILQNPRLVPANTKYPKNTRGRIAVTIAYSESSPFVTNANDSCNDFYDRVIDAYSYDADGNIITKWKYLPTAPLQESQYTYDAIQGYLTKEVIKFGPNPDQQVVREYTYGVNGKLYEVIVNGKKALKYLYDTRGRLIKSTFTRSDTLTAGTVQYTYDKLHDWVTSINSPSVFSENLTYLETGRNLTWPRQYTGNISRSVVSQQGVVSNGTLDLDYKYDDVDRLTGVVHNAPATGDNRFDALYGYDLQGRFTSKQEGTDICSTYVYEKAGTTTTNKLSYVDSKHHGTKNYVWDPNGNMVIDFGKKLGIAYDWRNLPVEFRFYSYIPSNVLWNEAANLEKVRSGVQLISTVKMLYDAAGNRVVKEVTGGN